MTIGGDLFYVTTHQIDVPSIWLNMIIQVAAWWWCNLGKQSVSIGLWNRVETLLVIWRGQKHIMPLLDCCSLEWRVCNEHGCLLQPRRALQLWTFPKSPWVHGSGYCWDLIWSQDNHPGQIHSFSVRIAQVLSCTHQSMPWKHIQSVGRDESEIHDGFYRSRLTAIVVNPRAPCRNPSLNLHDPLMAPTNVVMIFVTRSDLKGPSGF